MHAKSIVFSTLILFATVVPGYAVTPQDAFQIALENAGVPKSDVQKRKIEPDNSYGFLVYDVEFETKYGDYDFSVIMDGGRIIDADYDVDEDWLAKLKRSPIDIAGAKRLVQDKTGGVPLDKIRIWQEKDDGRTIFEGDAFHNGIKYEFEIDGKTGVIFDWNADFRGEK